MARMRRPFRLALMVAALCCALALLFGYRVQHTLDRLAHSAEADRGLPFTLRPLERGHGPAPFEAVVAVPGYTSGAQLEGSFYLAGPEGLAVLAADGSERARLRTGLELPVAQIVAVAVGRIRGAAEPQVLLATEGAGVLIVEPSKGGTLVLQQLLPSTADTADITALQVLASGELLAGTRHAGVLVFDGQALRPLALHVPGVDSARLQVTALAAADAASVLIGTRNQGVFSLRGGTAAHAGSADGLPDDQVESLLVAGRRAYVGTPLGVADFDLAEGSFRPARTLAPGLFAHTLALSPDGHELSAGTLDQGIRRIPLQAAARLRSAALTLAEGPVAGQRVDQLVPTPAGIFALVDGRLTSPGANSLRVAEKAQLLTHRNVSALAFNDQGALFVGYFDSGLDVLANGAVTHFEDDSLFCVNRLVLDPRRRTMAAATANGLVLFDAHGTPRQTLTRRDGLISGHVTDIAFTRAGTVLATPAGLTFVNADGMESLYAFQGLVNNHVYALAADPATDHVLAGTLGGLSELDGEQVRRNLTAANSGLKHNWITALAQTAPGEWLVGTYGAGLMRVSANGTFSPIDLPAGARRDLVINPNAILVTPSHIYAGTLGQGMLVYSNASGRWSSVTAGLPSLNVTAFAARAGELYVGTDNGLVHGAEASR